MNDRWKKKVVSHISIGYEMMIISTVIIDTIQKFNVIHDLLKKNTDREIVQSSSLLLNRNL